MPTPLIDTLKMHAPKNAPAEPKPKPSAGKPQAAKSKPQTQKKAANKKRKAEEAMDSGSDDDVSKNLDDDLSHEEENPEELMNELINVMGLKDINGRKKSKAEPVTQQKSSSESSEVSSEEEDSSDDDDKEKTDEKPKKPRNKCTTTTFALEGSVLERIGEKTMEESISGLTAMFPPQLRGDSLTRANRFLNATCVKVMQKLESEVDPDKDSVIGADEIRAVLAKFGGPMDKAIEYADRVMKNMEANPDLCDSLKTTMNEKRFDTKITEEASKVMHATRFNRNSVPQGVYVDMESMHDLSADSRVALVKFFDTLRANNGKLVYFEVYLLG